MDEYQKMNNYNWIATTIGIVLALGMTRLLASWVALFRSRKRVTLDWVPPVWSMGIFFSMLDFSWVIHRFTGTEREWTFASCVILLGFAVILYAASALILSTEELPEGSSLRSGFAEDGRWALILLALYDFLCIFMNWFYWDDHPVSFGGAVNLTLAGLALMALKSSSRKVVVLATVLYTAIIFGVVFLIA